MTALPLPVYVGLALMYAMAGTAAWGGFALAFGRRTLAGAAPTVCAMLFFLALAFHPLPDIVALSSECPLASAEPNWSPLGFVRDATQAWEDQPNLAGFARHNPLYSAVMNLLLCVLVGKLWKQYISNRYIAAGLGFAFSLFVEVTQATGVFGVYPCAYRKFDVDDLLLNTVGVVIGFVL
ncbi:VanZ family protein [Rubellimicrobium aerolatum]|uniref:VanZ family protein n=1 Tax=Rubellimicrobium aerolatum TaxID=490979 RepID=A0ABW0SIC3_9RHOB|nr:VanZ family protein [Rubellimicrobium aerolatum]MBP1807769.1 hypothetical protein [Rubellimicrobium aerolatum]